MAKIDPCLRGADAAGDLDHGADDPTPLAARFDDVLDAILKGVADMTEQAEMLSRRVDRAEQDRK